MGYKLKRILIYPDGVTEKQVRPKKVWDFQNQGQLGWTKDNGSADFGYDSGEGLYSKIASGYSVGGLSIAPSSDFYVEGRTISKITIRYYAPDNYRGVGVVGDVVFRYVRGPSYLTQIGWSNSTYATVGNITGEIKLEMNITSTAITGKINGTAFTVTDSKANSILTKYQNKTLLFGDDVWNSQSGKTYIRKIEVEYI